MPSSTKTLEKTPNAELLKLAEKIALKMNNDKKSKNSSTNCSAAVQIQTKGKVNEGIESGKPVFRLEKENKYVYYTQCSRKAQESKKLCFKHNQTLENNPKNLNYFKDINENEKSYKMTKTDLLDVKKRSNTKVTTKKNSDPIINITLNKNLRDRIENILKEIDGDNTSSKDVSDAESESEAEEAIPEEIEEPEVNEEAKAESETEEPEIEESEADDSDDEATTIEIETKDGRVLYLEQDSNTVYELDEEDEGVEIGKLMPINDKSAPIYHKDIEKYCIVGKTIIDNNTKYIRCTLTNKLYLKKNAKLTEVGKVNITKDKSFKVVLNKKSGKKN